MRKEEATTAKAASKVNPSCATIFALQQRSRGATYGCRSVDDCHTHTGYREEMDAERTIAEIECLERILLEPDARPLRLSDVAAANRGQDALLPHTPWFQLWQEYGVCCRVMRAIRTLNQN